MKLTTEAMHRGLSRAVVELRARMGWSQPDLAREISKYGARTKLSTPDRITISRWENGDRSPSPVHRMVLAKLAAKYRHEDLAVQFRAAVSAWRLVGYVKLGLKGEE